MLDENGRIIEEGPEPKPQLKGESRTFRVLLDPNQYHQDMERAAAGGQDTYDSFNILMRRKPKENNFKAVLETIRELMNTQCVVPEFLHDIILGYGNPGAAHYRNMDNFKSIANPKTLNFNDTFLNFEHLRQSFPMYDVKVDVPESDLVPPFKVTFNEISKEDNMEVEGAKPFIHVAPFKPENRGPYPKCEPKKNAVPFTPTQVEAIRAGISPGLTMVVGPPGMICMRSFIRLQSM